MISNQKKSGSRPLVSGMIASLVLHGFLIVTFIWFEQHPSKLTSLWQGGGKSGQIFISLAPASAQTAELKNDAKPAASPALLTQQKLNPNPLQFPKTNLKKDANLPTKPANPPLSKSKGDLGNGQGKGPGEGNGTGDGFDATGAQSANLLAKIRQRIFAKKDYPLIARENGDTGNVLLEFSINTDGSLKEVHLIKSSGISLLDKAAVASVKRAAPLPYYPEPIRLTLAYTLNE